MSTLAQARPPIADLETPAPWRVAGRDLLAFGLASALGAALLWYLHGSWQPRWALLCGLIGGPLSRRLVRPSYAEFPTYIRRPLTLGVIVLGSVIASWSTLATEPLAYWVLRWREAVTLPILGSILGLGLSAVIYTHRRLEQEIAAKQRLEEDLQVASRIQQSLLRSTAPRRTWLDVHALNLASRQVGGDYYEIIDAGDDTDRVCLAVGDVSGKGVPAALLMSSLQSSFLAAHSIQDTLDEVCSLVNRFLFDHTTPERYATFFVASMARDGSLSYVNAGHNPALIVERGATAQARRLFGGGMPLGLFAQSPYVEHRADVLASDVLVIYTDGVTEASNAAGEEFGEERLAEAVRSSNGASTEQMAEAVLSAVEAHVGVGGEQTDDLTLLLVQRLEGVTPVTAPAVAG